MIPNCFPPPDNSTNRHEDHNFLFTYLAGSSLVGIFFWNRVSSDFRIPQDPYLNGLSVFIVGPLIGPIITPFVALGGLFYTKHWLCGVGYRSLITSARRTNQITAGVLCRKLPKKITKMTSKSSIIDQKDKT